MEEGYKIYGMFDGEGNDFESLEEATFCLLDQGPVLIGIE